MPTIERATSGLTEILFERRRRRVPVVLRLVATQTSTTTGKTIGRRFVCS